MALKQLLVLAAQHLRDSIFPSLCAYCKVYQTERTVLCDRCMIRIAPVVSQQLTITKKKSINVFAVSLYQEPLKSLILAKRWSDRYASNQRGQLIWERTVLAHVQFDYLVPIPLHWTRYATRGFNQAEVMAQRLAQF